MAFYTNPLILNLQLLLTQYLSHYICTTYLSHYIFTLYYKHTNTHMCNSGLQKFMKSEQNFIKIIIFSYEIKISEYELQNVSNIRITNDGSAYMALLTTSTNCCYSKLSITTDKQHPITSILYVINWRIKIWSGRRQYLQTACKMYFTGNEGLFRIFLGPMQKHILEAPSMHTAELTMKTRTM